MQNAYLELLPGPAIPHRHSRFITRTQAAVADGVTLLSAELLQPGRKHYGEGELFEYDLYSAALTVDRPDGIPLFTEKRVSEPMVTVCQWCPGLGWRRGRRPPAG